MSAVQYFANKRSWESAMISCVIWRALFCVISITFMLRIVFLSFGGGSELLRDGDKNHIWSVLHDSMVYVPVSVPQWGACSPFSRIATFLGHVPWLGVYIGHIPGSAASLNLLISHGRKLAQERVNRGAKRHELFHCRAYTLVPAMFAPKLPRAISGFMWVLSSP